MAGVALHVALCRPEESAGTHLPWMRTDIPAARPANPAHLSMKAMNLPRILSAVVLTVWFMTATDSYAQSQRRRTTRKNLKPIHMTEKRPVSVPDTIALDTLDSPDNHLKVRLSGYDKPLRSTRESLFATNRTPYDIDGIILKLTYIDSSGRELHSRLVTVRCDIPRGATRKIDFRSWDSQQSFYYKLSPKPKRDGATPYDIKCHATAIIIPSTSVRNSHD